MGCPWCQKGHGSSQATAGCSTPAPGIVPIPISPPLSCSLPVAPLRPGAITTAATATTGMRCGICTSQGGRPARTPQRSTSVATDTPHRQARARPAHHVRTGAAGGEPSPHGQQAALDAVEAAQQAADALRQTLATLADDAKEDAILDALPALAPLDTIAWMRLKRQLKTAVPYLESE